MSAMRRLVWVVHAVWVTCGGGLLGPTWRPRGRVRCRGGFESRVVSLSSSRDPWPSWFGGSPTPSGNGTSVGVPTKKAGSGGSFPAAGVFSTLTRGSSPQGSSALVGGGRSGSGNGTYVAYVDDLSRALRELPVLRDLQQKDAGRETDELLSALSKAAEQAVREASSTNPLDFARGVMSVAAGTVAGLSKEVGSPDVAEAEIAALANALLRDGYFDDTTGVSSLFPEAVGVERVDVSGRDAAFVAGAVRAARLSSASYANSRATKKGVL